MRKKLELVIVLLAIAGSCWGIFTYMNSNLASCEDVKKIDQKIDKTLKLMDYRFSTIELKSIEERIYDAEKKYGSAPVDPIKAAELNKLKRDREQVLREMEEIKKK